MAEEFKCGACGHDKVHVQMIAGNSGRVSDRILDIRNPAIDSRIMFKACEKCHVIHGFWEKLSSSDVDNAEKEKIAKNQKLSQTPKGEG